MQQNACLGSKIIGFSQDFCNDRADKNYNNFNELKSILYILHSQLIILLGPRAMK